MLNRTCQRFALASLLGMTATLAAAPLPVGQPAPKFTLKNQAGKETSLTDLAKDKPVALVFYRSADW